MAICFLVSYMPLAGHFWPGIFAPFELPWSYLIHSAAAEVLYFENSPVRTRDIALRARSATSFAAFARRRPSRRRAADAEQSSRNVRLPRERRLTSQVSPGT